MDRIVNVPFKNLSYYQDDKMDARVTLGNAVARGTEIHLGCSWDGEKTTDCDFGKIKISLSGLSLTALPSGTRIEFKIKNTTNWCGAGYLQSYVTQTNYDSVYDFIIDGTTYDLQSQFQLETKGTCSTDFKWSDSALNEVITFTSGSLKDLTVSDIYIYIMDTNFNYSNPGSTTSIFNEECLQVNLILPYSNVNIPVDLQFIATDRGETSDSYTSIYCQDSIILKWNAPGAVEDNPIAGYKIYKKQNGILTLIAQLNNSITSYNYKSTVTKNNYYTIGIQSIGTYEETESSIIYFDTIFRVIDSPPSAPTFGTQGIIGFTSEGNNTIRVLSLNSIDVDGDPINYLYVVDGNEANPSNGGNPIVNGQTITMTKETPYLHIRAFQTNNGTKGEWTTKKIPVNTKPTSKFSYDVNHNNNYLGSISNLKCFFTNQTAGLTSHTWKIYDYSETSSVPIFVSTSSVVNNIKIIPDEKQLSNNIRIELTITDEAGDTFSYAEITRYKRPSRVVPTNARVYSEVDQGIIDPKYIGKKIKFETIMNITDDIPRTLKFFRGLNNSYIEIASSEIHEAGVYGPFSSGAIESTEYTFKVQAIDCFGNITESIINDKYYLLPSFNVTNFNFSKTVWEPLALEEENTLQFSSSYSRLNGQGTNSYTIKALCEGQEYILAEKIAFTNSDWEISIEGSTVYFKISNRNLFSKLKRSTNTPQIVITYIIIGYNAFGDAGMTDTCTCKLITQHAPKWEGSTSLIADTFSEAREGYENWVNAGEDVSFAFPNFKDLNDTRWEGSKTFNNEKTIKKYQLDYKYNEDDAWKSLQGGDFLVEGRYLTSITIDSMPAIFQNNTGTNVIIGLRLVDDNNNSSEYATTTIYICRREKPVFIVDSASLEGTELKLNFKFSDFGGNDREIENFTRRGTERSTISITFVAEDAALFRSQSFNNNELSKFTPTTFSVSETKSSKISIEVTLEIITRENSFGEEDSVTAKTTFILYQNSPTVSHRAHWVGINTNEMGDNEVFKISRFNDKKLIKLVGSNENNDIEIIINLETGEISNMTISGGTW